MAVITIARQFGAGGKTMGTVIAEKLGYTLIDEEIVELVAREANVSSDWVDDIERKAGSEGLISRILNRFGPLQEGYVKRAVESNPELMDGKRYVALLCDIIPRIAAQDNVIIVGRGAQYILAERPDTFHFLLIADLVHRIEFIREHYHLDEKQARIVVAKQSKRRLQLYRFFGRIDYDNPDLYHLVFNMNKVTMDSASAIICQLVAPQAAS